MSESVWAYHRQLARIDQNGSTAVSEYCLRWRDAKRGKPATKLRSTHYVQEFIERCVRRDDLYDRGFGE